MINNLIQRIKKDRTRLTELKTKVDNWKWWQIWKISESNNILSEIEDIKERMRLRSYELKKLSKTLNPSDSTFAYAKGI